MIKAGGSVVNQNGAKPRYYVHHVAFLDADGNLIACGGDPLSDNRVGSEPESRSQDLPIPPVCEARIAQYRSVFYESSAPIGTRRTQPSSFPSELNPKRETNNSSAKLNTKHRKLFDGTAGVHAYTVDGACMPRSGNKQDQDAGVLIGDPSRAQAKVFFRADKKGIAVYYSLANHTESSTHQDLYVAFLTIMST